jgi:hypothetical protein
MQKLTKLATRRPLAAAAVVLAAGALTLAAPAGPA